MSERVAVIGAGSWGTALANLLAKKEHDVTVWSYEADVADAINREHRNPRYLSEIALHPGLKATTSLEDVVRDAGCIVSVSPAQHVRKVMDQACEHMQPDALVVAASKGIETSSLQTMAQVHADVLPKQAGARACFLSGPSFALEVAHEQPTAVTIASHDLAAAEAAQELFQTPYFRAYTSDDVVGVELGGALKNVIAVAAGMGVGLGLGHNATAALITRGLAEITRLGMRFGANPMTLSGLAGMGDLILTCTGGLSRNRHVGVELGKGRSIDDVLGEMTMVAEGVETTRAAHALAQRAGIEMPIVAEVHAVLFEGRSAQEALENLMTRDPKPELWQ
ncbi:MAG TPA: NAD(P)H-dependent glycerol-3-phosphate dehydrogenase [Longimicrobiales bacterium]|nr:NAD(P)H-dependent glycerol-3-phosphate dehydrogenase [Longimicrobiales bacterium]